MDYKKQYFGQVEILVSSFILFSLDLNFSFLAPAFYPAGRNIVSGIFTSDW